MKLERDIVADDYGYWTFKCVMMDDREMKSLILSF